MILKMLILQHVLEEDNYLFTVEQEVNCFKSVNMYKVLITTSGTGSRLKELTQNTNKALLQIAGKPVIDYIIECYNPQIELVITIGYYGNEVKNYITQRYSGRIITFITVDPYKGPKSSVGYSLLQAKDYLQCPFIFHCNDTIVKDDIPSPEEYNWDGVSLGNDPEIFNTQSYSSVIIEKGRITEMQMKGAEKFDSFHIGLVGIKDYKEFWRTLEDLYIRNPNDSTLNDCATIIHMLQNGQLFLPANFERWYDTGSLVSLKNAEENLRVNLI